MGQAKWHEQADLAAQALVKVQDPAKIPVKADKKTDAITGCTLMVKDFLDAATKALQAAK